MERTLVPPSISSYLSNKCLSSYNTACKNEFESKAHSQAEDYRSPGQCEKWEKFFQNAFLEVFNLAK